MAEASVGSVQPEVPPAYTQLEELNPIIRAARAAQAASSSSTTTPVTISAAEESSSSSTSRSITERVTIDSPKAISEEDALDALNTGLAEMQAYDEEKAKNAAQQQTTMKLIEDTLLGKSKDEQLIADVKNNAELRQQLKEKEIAKAADTEKRLVELATGRRAAVDRSLAKQKELEDNVNLQFVDDPFQWIVNQFTVDDVKEEADVAAAGVAKYDNAISGLSSLATHAENALERTKQTMNTATVAAQSRNIAANALLTAKEYELKSQELGAQRLTDLMTMSKERRDVMLTGYNISTQAQQRKEEQIDRELRRAEIKGNTQNEDVFVAGVRRGRAELGLPVLETEEEKIEILLSREGDKELTAKTYREFSIGINQASLTPFETARAFATSNKTKVTDGENRGLAALAEVETSLNEKESVGAISIDKDNQEALYNAETAEVFSKHAENIRPGDETNPNKAEPLSILVAAASVKNEPLVVKVLNNILSDTTPDMPEAKVVLTAFEAVNKGEITLHEAVTGLNAIYGQAIAHNNVMQERKRWGLPLQKDYNIQLKTIGDVAKSFFTLAPGKEVRFNLAFTDKVNLADYTSLSRAAVSYMASVRRIGIPWQEQLDKAAKNKQAQENK